MWSDIVNFFNSPFFATLMTFVVGLFAYGVYRKRQEDEKERAARVILLEIEQAEQQLTKTREDKPLPDPGEEQIRLMPVASWDTYKHLFTHDFDRNESDKIADFYDRCQAYDEAGRMYDRVAFEQSQHELRVNAQRVLADYAREYNDAIERADNNESSLRRLEADYIERRQRFIEIYGNTSDTHMYTYVPVRPENDARRALRGLEPSLSLTSVGTKFKNMCAPRGWFGWRKHF